MAYASSFLESLLTNWAHTLLWMAGLAVGFGLLALVMPCNPGSAWWKDRRAALTDVCYWFLVPLVVKWGRILMLFAGMALLFDLRDKQSIEDFFDHGYGPLSTLPMVLQCVLILLVQDVMMYWLHRLFHGNALWKFHAIHHSPTSIDWMTSARFHPVNSLLYSSLADVAVLLAGFSPQAMIWLAPLNTIYSGMVHANLNWTFGPLRFVFASPVFHRWHHTSVKEGGMKNFAPTFPFLDVLFGTFYMPAGRRPEKYGVFDDNFPQTFWKQMLHPFKK